MDEDEIRTPAMAHLVGMKIDEMSVDELEERIGMLEAEIARLRLAIEARRHSRSAADSFFKPG